MATKKTTKGTVGRPKKVNTPKTAPTEDDIRKKAEEIYRERIARGEYGTAEDDWHKAEKILKGQ